MGLSEAVFDESFNATFLQSKLLPKSRKDPQ
jgi:hypothetical protein